MRFKSEGVAKKKSYELPAIRFVAVGESRENSEKRKVFVRGILRDMLNRLHQRGRPKRNDGSDVDET